MTLNSQLILTFKKNKFLKQKYKKSGCIMLKNDFFEILEQTFPYPN